MANFRTRGETIDAAVKNTTTTIYLAGARQGPYRPHRKVTPYRTKHGQYMQQRKIFTGPRKK
jgi:hypothetical protein